MIQINCTEVTNSRRASQIVRELKMPLFVLFLSIYLFTVAGNLGLILVIRQFKTPHTNVHFFLSNLAFVDFLLFFCHYTQNAGSFLYNTKCYPFQWMCCPAGLFPGLHDCQCLLLASMAYGRYVAVCNLSLYMVVMSPGVCVQLVAVPYGWLPGRPVHAILTFHLSYCHSISSIISILDDMPLLRLTRSDTHSKQLWILPLAGLMFISSLLIVFVSYVYIASAILKMRLRCRQTPRLSHLWLPHAGSHHILWNPHLYVLTAKF